jgi:ABC-2 type transport system permease protein
MNSVAAKDQPAGFSLAQYLTCLNGIVWREGLRFIHQRERFISALVRPLVWLFIFAAGFRQVLGISIIPPYETYILYEVYIMPGLMAMIQLFNGMQSSLSMVYDREMGNMRTLLVSPLPRWYLLFCKLLAGTAVSVLQVYAFLGIAWFWDIEPPPVGYLMVLPALVLSGLMLGSLGMLISSGIKQLENFAGVMNFVIFPMFFASSALYPLWRVQEGSPMLYYVCQLNPFTHAVELIRFALYGRMNWLSFAVVAGCTAAFMIGAILAYDPSRGLSRRGPAGGETSDGRRRFACCSQPPDRLTAAKPPIRAIRTGPAPRPRCLKSRSLRSGMVPLSTTPRPGGKTTPRSARWCRALPRAAPRSMKRKKRSRNFCRLRRPKKTSWASCCLPVCSIRSMRNVRR